MREPRRVRCRRGACGRSGCPRCRPTRRRRRAMCRQGTPPGFRRGNAAGHGVSSSAPPENTVQSAHTRRASRRAGRRGRRRALPRLLAPSRRGRRGRAPAAEAARRRKMREEQSGVWVAAARRWRPKCAARMATTSAGKFLWVCGQRLRGRADRCRRCGVCHKCSSDRGLRPLAATGDLTKRIDGGHTFSSRTFNIYNL